MAPMAFQTAPWRDPVLVAAAFADEPHLLALLSDGRAGRWSYVMRRPKQILMASSAGGGDPWEAARNMLGPRRHVEGDPPFQGGLAGLIAYETAALSEPTAPGERSRLWPDMAVGLYRDLLAFDHQERRVFVFGEAHDWLEVDAPPALNGALAADFAPASSDAAYEAAVADVVEAIAEGEVFQANIARAWRGRLKPGARPFDLAARLVAVSPAPFAAYMRLGGLALVSNSPERFLEVGSDGEVVTQPIKGTRPRGIDPAQDAALADELVASAKDRAENLMIVDLMRNDLARVCRPGSVRAEPLFALESFANVHHLVSRVTGRLQADRSALDLMRAAFPPGSITGAPKLQAMKVIARHEPPRGPYCGSIFWAGFDGAMDSSVLIRTAAFEADDGGWAFEARAGAGIVADSVPHSESQETWAKIAAIRQALTGGPTP